MKKALAAVKRGFTLIELIVTIVIVGILAGIAIVGYTGVTSDAQAKADDASAEINARRVAMEMALEDVAMSEANFLATAAGDVASDLEGSFANDGGDVDGTVVYTTADGERTVEVQLVNFGL